MTDDLGAFYRCPLPCPLQPHQKFQKSTRFANRISKGIHVIGMRSVIIGLMHRDHRQSEPRSSDRTEIIGWAFLFPCRTGAGSFSASQLKPTGSEIIGDLTCGFEHINMENGSEIIGPLVSLVGQSLLETAKSAIGTHQTHKADDHGHHPYAFSARRSFG